MSTILIPHDGKPMFAYFLSYTHFRYGKYGKRRKEEDVIRVKVAVIVIGLNR